MLPLMPRTLRSKRHKALVAALTQARRNAGLSQRTLSERLKVSQTWVASIESGQRRVDVIEFLDLCYILRIDPTETLSKL